MCGSNVPPKANATGVLKFFDVYTSETSPELGKKKIVANRRAVGTLNPLRDKMEGIIYRGGGRDDTCGHGLSRRPPRVKPIIRVELEVKVMIKQHENHGRGRYSAFVCKHVFVH